MRAKIAKLFCPSLKKCRGKSFRIWYDKGIEAGTEWPNISQNKTIGVHAFGNCKKLKHVYYKGAKSDWKKININNSSGGNAKLTALFGGAVIYYNAQ